MNWSTAKDIFVNDPKVQEFITRKTALLELVSQQHQSEMSPRTVAAIRSVAAISGIQVDADDPSYGPNDLRFLHAMCMISPRIFDKDVIKGNLSDKELRQIVELDLFSIHNFMDTWNLIIEHTKEYNNPSNLCDKFLS